MANGDETSTGRGVIITSLVLGFVSIVTQIVGLATNGWVVLYTFTQTSSPRSFVKIEVSMGLWVVRYCVNNVCKTTSVDDYFNQFEGIDTGIFDARMDEYRAETILGVIFMFVVLICMVIKLCGKLSGNPNGNCRNHVAVWVVASISALLSAVMALTASGKFGQNYVEAHNTLNRSVGSPYLVPYSIIVTGVGGLLAVALFILLAVVTCGRFNLSNVNRQDQTVAMTTHPTFAPHYDVRPSRTAHHSYVRPTTYAPHYDVRGQERGYPNRVFYMSK